MGHLNSKKIIILGILAITFSAHFFIIRTAEMAKYQHNHQVAKTIADSISHTEIDKLTDSYKYSGKITATGAFASIQNKLQKQVREEDGYVNILVLPEWAPDMIMELVPSLGNFTAQGRILSPSLSNMFSSEQEAKSRFQKINDAWYLPLKDDEHKISGVIEIALNTFDQSKFRALVVQLYLTSIGISMLLILLDLALSTKPDASPQAKINPNLEKDIIALHNKVGDLSKITAQALRYTFNTRLNNTSVSQSDTSPEKETRGDDIQDEVPIIGPKNPFGKQNFNF